MLRVRVLTAAVLGPLFILGVLYLPQLYFALLTGAVILFGAWEWTHLSGYSGNKLKTAAIAAIAVLMGAAYLFRDSATEPLLMLACAIWLVVAAALFRRRHHSPLSWPGAVRWACGAWVLVPAWLAISVLQDTAPGAALMLLALIWGADTGAYFAGRRWGRRKLAPAISPGKSIEGVWGGVATAVVVATGFGVFWGFDLFQWLGLVLWSAAVALVSVIGDLFESNWKRLAKLKDSGDVLPGHGGVLDRIDSMTAAAPFFALGWLWWFGATPA